jgi:hypothetical protein
MKKIWAEEVGVGHYVTKEPMFDGNNIYVRTIGVTLHAKGYHDATLCHTVLNLFALPSYNDADEPFPWLLQDCRLVADGHTTRAAATRWIIQQIDRVAAQLNVLIPPADTRSDEEILASAHTED